MTCPTFRYGTQATHYIIDNVRVFDSMDYGTATALQAVWTEAACGNPTLETSQKLHKMGVSSLKTVLATGDANNIMTGVQTNAKEGGSILDLTEITGTPTGVADCDATAGLWVWIYISDVTNVETAAALSILIGDGTYTVEQEYAKTDLVQGWNRYGFDFKTATGGSTPASMDWTAVTTVAVELDAAAGMGAGEVMYIDDIIIGNRRDMSHEFTNYSVSGLERETDMKQATNKNWVYTKGLTPAEITYTGKIDDNIAGEIFAGYPDAETGEDAAPYQDTNIQNYGRRKWNDDSTVTVPYSGVCDLQLQYSDGVSTGERLYYTWARCTCTGLEKSSDADNIGEYTLKFKCIPDVNGYKIVREYSSNNTTNPITSGYALS